MPAGARVNVAHGLDDSPMECVSTEDDFAQKGQNLMYLRRKKLYDIVARSGPFYAS